MRPGISALTTAAVAATATLLVAVVPFLKFAYRSAEAHVATETAAALIAFITAVLVGGRFRIARRLDDLVLLWALAVLTMLNVWFAVIGVVADTADAARWGAILARVAAAALFFAASAAPGRELASRRAVPGLLLVAPISVLGLAAAVGGLLDELAPLDLGPPPSPADATRPIIVTDAALVGPQLLMFALYAGAAFGWARKARDRSDVFVQWLAPAAVLAAFSRLNYLLFPSFYSDWVYVGDVLRIAFYLALLGAAVHQLRAYWVGLAEVAVLEERRRLARDLHDGLAQELAFIRREIHQPTSRESVAAAADRALDESRRAIAALTRRIDEPLPVAIAQVAEDVAARVGTTVRLDLEDVEVAHEEREELLRIVSEGITNAARHGDADVVSVELRRDGGLRLRIVDDGCGFDASSPTTGFGLRSMRERAERLGGTLAVDSRRGRGTALEVTVP